MKRKLFIAAIIGLFLVAASDLQAHHRRNGLPQLVRGGIAFALLSQITLHNHHHGYARHHDRQEQHIVKEIRKTEKRIWKLEKRINKLERHHDNYRKIRTLEHEIDWLQRRNDYLRSQLY